MRTLIIIIILLLAPNAYAGDELYAIQAPDGVKVLRYFPGSSDTVEDLLKEQGLWGLPILRIQVSDLPDRKERAFWKLNDLPFGEKIIIDQVKKKKYMRKMEKKRSEKLAILLKMGITEEEFRKIDT